MFVLFNHTHLTESVRFSGSFLKDRILHRKLNKVIDVNLEEDASYLDKRKYLNDENSKESPKVYKQLNH